MMRFVRQHNAECYEWETPQGVGWLFGLTTHQRLAYAAFWRSWNGGRK